ncbi:MAG: hypothetical protein IH600_12610 [Bacteroidetes bacterium]|nr:hypothetical protein [Bacteroidota bacterium]
MLVRWIEEAAAVPYRHWRKYEMVGTDGGRRTVSFRYILNDGMRIDTSPDRLLGIQGLPIWRDASSGSDVYVILLDAFRNALTDYLQAHPHHFIIDRDLTDLTQRSPVIRLDHIGVVSKYEDQIRKLLPLLGGRLAYQGPVDAIGVLCEYHALANVDIEIVSPMQEDSIVSAQRTKLPFHPLHHLAFEVEGLEAGVEYFRAHGYHPIDGKVLLAPKPYHRVVFLSPMQTRGLLIELVADEGRSFDVYGGTLPHAEGTAA